MKIIALLFIVLLCGCKSHTRATGSKNSSYIPAVTKIEIVQIESEKQEIPVIVEQEDILPALATTEPGEEPQAATVEKFQDRIIPMPAMNKRKEPETTNTQKITSRYSWALVLPALLFIYSVFSFIQFGNISSGTQGITQGLAVRKPAFQ
jgi:hypothetical protein